MIRKFFKDSFLYSINNVFSLGISIVLVPIYTRIFSPADYGIIDIIAIITTLVNLTIALEISQGLARFYPEAKDQEARSRLASTSLFFTIAAYSIFLIIVLFFSAPLSEWAFGESGKQLLFIIAMSSIFLNGILYYLQNLLRWQLKSKLFTLVSLSTSFTAITLKLILVIVFDLGLMGVFIGILVGNIVGVALSLYYTKSSFQILFDQKQLKIMLTYSLPLVLSSVGVYFSFYIDRIAIKELLSLHEVGLYGIGYKVASLITILLVGCQGALTPLIYSYYQEKETPQKVANIFRYFILIAAAAFLGISLMSGEIVYFFTTEAYYASQFVIPFLVPAKLLFGMYIFAPGLAIAKKTGTVTIINLAVAALNITLNFLLIPIWGIIGAALATLFSSLVSFVSYLNLGQKFYAIPFEWKRIVMAILFVTALIIIVALINFPLTLVSFAIKTVIIIGGCLVITILLINKAEYKLLVSSAVAKCNLLFKG